MNYKLLEDCERKKNENEIVVEAMFKKDNLSQNYKRYS